MTVTLSAIAFAFAFGFFAGLGWALAHWIVARLTALVPRI